MSEAVSTSLLHAEPDDLSDEATSGTLALIRARIDNLVKVAPNYEDVMVEFEKRVKISGVKPRQVVYLVALARCGYSMRSRHIAGISNSDLCKWRKTEPFAALEEDARLFILEVFETEVDRRAFVGYPEDVYGRGGLLGTITKYSDNLATLRLKAIAPEKYADRKKTEHTGRDGGPIQVQPVVERLAQRLDAIALRREQQQKEEKV